MFLALDLFIFALDLFILALDLLILALDLLILALGLFLLSLAPLYQTPVLHHQFFVFAARIQEELCQTQLDSPSIRAVDIQISNGFSPWALSVSSSMGKTKTNLRMMPDVICNRSIS